MARQVPFIICCCVLVSAGCDPSFDPKGSFEKALAVYTVLSPLSDTQFVRVHATYDPPEFDPLAHTDEPDLSAAQVRITWEGGALTLSDSLVPHPDAGRYGSQLRVFIGTPLVPERGRTYTLTVTVPGYGTATGAASVPQPSQQLRVSDPTMLSAPGLYDGQDIIVTFRAPPEARGYLMRFYMLYDVLSPVPSTELVEVPQRLVEVDGSSTPRYADLAPLTLAVGTPFTVVTAATFQTEAYISLLGQVMEQHLPYTVRFRRAIFHLDLVDESLYSYYSIVNGFRDEFSIRTDLPDHTNVSGGVGVVGARARDTLAVNVSSNIQF